MTIQLCQVCFAPNQKETIQPNKIKSLVYVNVYANTEKVLDNMYAKDPRPNFHLEMGYNNSPESPDRFDEMNHLTLLRQIDESPLDLPPTDE